MRNWYRNYFRQYVVAKSFSITEIRCTSIIRWFRTSHFLGSSDGIHQSNFLIEILYFHLSMIQHIPLLNQAPLILYMYMVDEFVDFLTKIYVTLGEGLGGDDFNPNTFWSVRSIYLVLQQRPHWGRLFLISKSPQVLTCVCCPKTWGTTGSDSIMSLNVVFAK